MMRGAVTSNRDRFIFAFLGLAFAAIVILAVVFMPSGREQELPAAVESIAPAPEATVQRQTDLVVDMAVGYRITLTIDDVPIPASEVNLVEATGVHTWRPGATSTFQEWAPGVHTVRVDYERVTGPADVGTVRWVFRTQ